MTEETSDGLNRIAIPEDRKERAQGGLNQYKVETVADATSRPVTERRQEAPIITEAGFRIGINAGVEIGFALRQSLEYQSEHQHSDTRDDPGQQGAIYSCHPAKRLRQRKDAGPHHGSHDHGGQYRKRELLGR